MASDDRSSATTGMVVALITSPAADAQRLARAIVEHKLAACVNVVADIQSVYRWEGEIEEAGESLLVVKTMEDALGALDELLREIHPHETFELIMLDITAGNHAYLQWIAASVQSPD